MQNYFLFLPAVKNTLILFVFLNLFLNGLNKIMRANSIIQKIPNYLRQFIVEQHYENYTGRDHAVWRYVMRRNKAYLQKHAHKSYIAGLNKTGISLFKIPSIEEMNIILGKIGWAAVCVDGFIPPAMFMLFQAYKVLVIASDIRNIDQVEYTPAPDIIHEAAGHAPIIADEEYANYLLHFGNIGSKALPSKKDHELYEAIRHLSILKADPKSSGAEISNAEDSISLLQRNMGMPSEMSLIRNLHWWTVEYGLIGDLKNPKIYGAGLLSSIMESKEALSPKVKKIPYSLDAMDYGFDITKPQEQLFVTPDFKHLNEVLDEFSNQMALKTGGIEGILKAIQSGEVSTIEYSSGIQVSGIFSDVIIHDGQAVYINTNGPTTLNYKEKLLPGHDTSHHKSGFGSPIGKIKGCLKPVRHLTDSELRQLGIHKGKYCKIELESGVIIEGYLIKTTRKDNKILLMSFKDCLVKHNEKILFEPSWGIYDMAVGEKITSVFSGPAQIDNYPLPNYNPTEKTHTINYSDEDLELFSVYEKINSWFFTSPATKEFLSLWNHIYVNYPNEWLLINEMLELTKTNSHLTDFKQQIESRLKKTY